jgi:C4-dicarboxylate-specific signal transduction histidine kinase
MDTLLYHFVTLIAERDVRYQQRFDAQTKAIEAALLAAKEAVVKAELATEKRFESVNEFRQTLSDQAAQFMTRGESEAATGRNTERIQELTDRVNRREGHGAGLNAGWVYLIAAVGVIGTVIAAVLSLRR